MCKNFRIGKNNEIKEYKTRCDRIFESVNHKICQKMNKAYFCDTSGKLAKLTGKFGCTFVL
jgi:hypothetical protein